MKKLLKKTYNIIPFKKQLFAVLRIFPLSNSIIQHLSFVGIFKVKLTRTCSIKMFHFGYQLENELFWKGINGWEKESIKLWIKEASKSFTIIDIGANTGVYSLIAKSVNPDSQVYAFEPVVRVFKKLEKNVQLNRFNIKIFCEAVSDKTGTAVIWDYKFDHEYAASLAKPENITGAQISYEIHTISLNDFIEKNNITKIDLIKIDVETFEPQVLEGYSKYFAFHKPKLLIEVLYNDIGEKIQTFLEKSGVEYDYFYIDEEKGLIKQDKISRCSDKYFNYFLMPKTISL